MTHVVKSSKGNNIFTYCGKYIDRQVIGRRTPGRPPALLYPGTDIFVHGFDVLCEKCMIHDKVVEIVEHTVINSLKYLTEIHVLDYYYSTHGINMLCGKAWDKRSMFRNNIGFINVEQYSTFEDLSLCSECSDHPKIQLDILSRTVL